MVYRLREDVENYQQLYVKRRRDLDKTHDWFTGSTMKCVWEPIVVDIVCETGDEKQLEGDFPHLIPGACVFSENAVKALEPLLLPNGELLPLPFRKHSYAVFI